MDPVSHVIFGRTLVAAIETPDGRRFGRGAAAASILGALSPDIDAVLMPQGWDIYLRAHEVGTHSILGAVIVGSLSGAVARMLSRGSRLGALALAGSAGAGSHLLLDLLSGARLQLAWPVVSGRLAWPLVAMADTWLIAFLSIVAAALWLNRRAMRRTAIVALIAAAVFFGAKSVLFARAQAAATQTMGERRGRTFEARWGSWHEWILFERRGGVLQTWLVDAWRSQVTLQLAWPVLEDSPDVSASRRLDTVRNFLDVHDLTFAIEERDPSGGRHVWWSDVRYCWKPDAGGSRIDCGLWFGGLFDREGRAVRQEVRLGTWLQTRPVTP